MGMPEEIGGKVDHRMAWDFAELVVLWLRRSKKDRGRVAELMNKRGYKRVSGTAISNWGLGERPDLRNAKGFSEVMADLLKMDPDQAWAIVQSLVMPMYLSGDKPRFVLIGSDLQERRLELVPTRTHDT